MTDKLLPKFGWDGLADCREIADLGVGTLGESFDVGQMRLQGLLGWYDELSKECESLGDMLSDAKTDLKQAQQDAKHWETEYRRLVKELVEISKQRYDDLPALPAKEYPPLTALKPQKLTTGQE